jgi:hypothetical protein
VPAGFGRPGPPFDATSPQTQDLPDSRPGRREIPCVAVREVCGSRPPSDATGRKSATLKLSI